MVSISLKELLYMDPVFCALVGQVAIVTGGARGIGRAIAEIFARRGADVVIADMQLELSKTTAAEIAEAYSRKTLALQVNVADFESARSMVDQVIATFGRLDILVNNAGVTRDTLIIRMDEARSEERR